MNIINQHLRWRIGSSVIAIFLRELSIISCIYSLRSSIDRACWSWSINISISSSNSLFTNSYYAINAKILSISRLRVLFFSRAAKCSFRSFYSYEITRSKSFSWFRIVASTAAILVWNYFPLPSSFSSAPFCLSSSALDLPACCS